MATIEPRTLKDGSKRYRVRVRILGELPRTRTFRRLTDAKAWAAKIETDMGHGAFVPTTADRRRTLRELVEKYRTEYLPTRGIRDASRHAGMLDWWADNFGHVTLDKLRPEMVAEGRRKLAARRLRDGTPITGATVNRYLAALSAVCKWAWKELRWLPSNPVLDVSKAPESTGIIRYLSDDERKALLAACRRSPDPNIYTAVILALATGARYSNIRNLRWDDVDQHAWRLRFTETKNGQPRHVPVVGPAQAALRAQYEADPTKDGWVFKGRGDAAPADLEKAWRKVRAEAGLHDFRFHDLRHTAASYLTMHGATLAEVAEALGHRTLVMAKRYSHQSGEHVRSTFERIAGRLADDAPESGESR
jgi:integrase